MSIKAREIIKKIGSIILVIVLSSTTVFVVRGEDRSSRQPQDVSGVLHATMEQLAETVKEPTFGTNAGEWTVFSLARGEYFSKNNAYFTDYYNRIVETVNQTATSVNKNGALDKNKSTENSRLIVALSAIGKDATAVGDWDLVEAYSANGINWIKKQGINGTIWSLIALDSNQYVTSEPTIRQQCVDAILASQHNDGGWSLITNKNYVSNVDVTCMALTALYPYHNQSEVATACEEAIQWLAEEQLSTGGFPYGNGETSESCAWAIVALTTWEINPDTDDRFVKNGKSAIDNLLTYYVEEDRMFAHQGTESNAMATDQACYALVAYERLVKGKTALFNYNDVSFGEEDVKEENEHHNKPEDVQSNELLDLNDKEMVLVIENKEESRTPEELSPVSYSAVCLYTGDDAELIPSTKKAIGIEVVGVEEKGKLGYADGTNEYEFLYSAEISQKTGVATYVALVDATIEIEQFENKENLTVNDGDVSEMAFGDTNGDGVINAQDALAVVNACLRKTDAPSDKEILVFNVNGDSRIDTFDALSIAEAYVDGTEYFVVTQAAILRTKK